MNRKLFTIGYTGFNLDEFVGNLKHQEIECLIDVREIPVSRKRGFSKTALSECLAQNGIGYKHLRMLGSPKALRHEVRETADFSKFFAGVSRHLSGSESQVQIADAIDIARHTRSCLMCCCSDWMYCHRKSVVKEILNHSFFFVEHLTLHVVSSTHEKAA
jgi:uncharacterized protein (DUF488 family)